MHTTVASIHTNLQKQCTVHLFSQRAPFQDIQDNIQQYATILIKAKQRIKKIRTIVMICFLNKELSTLIPLEFQKILKGFWIFVPTNKRIPSELNLEFILGDEY